MLYYWSFNQFRSKNCTFAIYHCAAIYLLTHDSKIADWTRMVCGWRLFEDLHIELLWFKMISFIRYFSFLVLVLSLFIDNRKVSCPFPVRRLGALHKFSTNSIMSDAHHFWGIFDHSHGQQKRRFFFNTLLSRSHEVWFALVLLKSPPCTKIGMKLVWNLRHRPGWAGRCPCSFVRFWIYIPDIIYIIYICA